MDRDERNDDAGRGWFRASRVNKPVTGHLGVDITGEPGTPVRSPIDGVIFKRGKAYKEKKYDRFDTVWINGTGDYQGLQIRMFYVDRVGPVNGNDKNGIGARVVGGTTIVGGLQDITQKGSNSKTGVKPHVHMQVYWHGKLIDPARVLPAWE